MPCHKVGDGLVEHVGAVIDEPVKDVALGEDSVDSGSIVADDERPDVLQPKPPRGDRDGRPGSTVATLAPLAFKISCIDMAGIPLFGFGPSPRAQSSTARAGVLVTKGSR